MMNKFFTFLMIFNFSLANVFVIDLCCDSIEESLQEKINHLEHDVHQHQAKHDSQNEKKHDCHEKEKEKNSDENHDCHRVCCTSISVMTVAKTKLTIQIDESELELILEKNQNPKDIKFQLFRPPTTIS